MEKRVKYCINNLTKEDYKLSVCGFIHYMHGSRNFCQRRSIFDKVGYNFDKVGFFVCVF